MTERPISLYQHEVKGILEGRLSQFRRIVKLRPENHTRIGTKGHQAHIESPEALNHCPYGQVGDRLWVRETHARAGNDPCTPVHYIADGPMPTMDERHDAGLLEKKPSNHMPRWASRINLEITGVRIERDSINRVWVVEFKEVIDD